jgi:hypothetical protein
MPMSILIPLDLRFSPYDRVTISYDNRPLLREGYVVADDGGPKVKVRWRAQDGPRTGRHVAWRGAEHIQLIPRHRLALR